MIAGSLNPTGEGEDMNVQNTRFGPDSSRGVHALFGEHWQTTMCYQLMSGDWRETDKPLTCKKCQRADYIHKERYGGEQK